MTKGILGKATNPCQSAFWQGLVAQIEALLFFGPHMPFGRLLFVEFTLLEQDSHQVIDFLVDFLVNVFQSFLCADEH